MSVLEIKKLEEKVKQFDYTTGTSIKGLTVEQFLGGKSGQIVAENLVPSEEHFK